MITAVSDITGILLAGGLSSRMGREKGLVRIGERYMYQYPLGVLQSLCKEILISTCGNLPVPEACLQVCDEIPGLGPIGGILTCLKRSANETCIILSYDLPVVSRDLLQYLLEESRGYDAVFPATRPGRPEPLCAVLRKKLVPVLEGLIARGEYAVHQVIPLANSRILPIGDHLPFYNPWLFLNINREEDLEKLPPGFDRAQPRDRDED